MDTVVAFQPRAHFAATLLSEGYLLMEGDLTQSSKFGLLYFFLPLALALAGSASRDVVILLLLLILAAVVNSRAT